MYYPEGRTRQNIFLGTISAEETSLEIFRPPRLLDRVYRYLVGWWVAEPLEAGNHPLRGVCRKILKRLKIRKGASECVCMLLRVKFPFLVDVRLLVIHQNLEFPKSGRARRISRCWNPPYTLYFQPNKQSIGWSTDVPKVVRFLERSFYIQPSCAASYPAAGVIGLLVNSRVFHIGTLFEFSLENPQNVSP